MAPIFQTVYPNEKQTSQYAYSDNPEALPVPVQVQTDKPAPKKRRPFRFILAFILLFLGVTHLGKIKRCHKSFKHLGYGGPDHDHDHHPGHRHGLPPNLHIEECADLTDDNRVVSYDLPISSDLLFFISRGATAGLFNVSQSEEEGDALSIEVDTTDWSPRDLHDLKVCRLSMQEGENGLGIFSHKRHRGHHIHGHIIVNAVLPKSSSKKPLDVKAFSTDLPLFHHTIGDLAPGVAFDTISLRSVNQRLDVESLYATSANVSTINSPIEGNFNVTDKLAIHTVNAHIRVNVSLDNVDEDEDAGLFLATVNAPIHANITLTTPKSNGGGFNISAGTVAAPIVLDVLSAPIDSSIHLNAGTVMAPATIDLPTTYEGGFKLSSSLHGKPEVIIKDQKAKDPKGKKRERTVTYGESTGSTVLGAVRWDEDGKARGFVEASSLLSPVTLYL